MSLFGDIMGYIDAGRASKSVSDANIAAEHGVLGAASAGQQGVNDSLVNTENKLSTALDKSTGAVYDATNAANTGLNANLSDILRNTAGYQQAGNTGLKSLTDLLSADKFSFKPEDYLNSDAYKFQLAQGQDAIQNRASAMGLSSSGNTLKDLTTFGQGLASTYYNDAFNRAKSTFETNRDTTLAASLPLVQAGEFGTNQANTATQNIGSEVARNTTDAGKFAGTAGLTLADLLARLQTQGAQFNAGLGLQGAKAAGDYAVGAGQAHAGGIMNQGAALVSGVSDLGGLLGQLFPGLQMGG